MDALPITPRPTASSLTTGLACGVGAGALWGLVFVAPALAGEFSPLQLTVGRYLCYGLIAALLLGPRWRRVRASLGRGDGWRLAWLALFGNTLYYVLLAAAVQAGGIATTSLVIGFLPVAVTLAGSRDHGAVPLRRLAPSLLLGALGVACIGWGALAGPAHATESRPLVGLACAVAALASWTAYAIGNARCLARLPQVSSHDWNLMTGLATGAQSLLLLPLALWLGAGDHDAGAWAKLGAVSLGVAVLASIIGNGLWNRMSRMLPMTLVGQMILFETLFALLYGWLWASRWPTALELVALGCVIASVVSCLLVHRPRGELAHAP